MGDHGRGRFGGVDRVNQNPLGFRKQADRFQTGGRVDAVARANKGVLHGEFGRLRGDIDSQNARAFAGNRGRLRAHVAGGAAGADPDQREVEVEQALAQEHPGMGAGRARREVHRRRRERLRAQLRPKLAHHGGIAHGANAS